MKRGVLAGKKLRVGRARCEGCQRVAQEPAVRAVLVSMAAVEMDELAELVDVLDRVHERRLPAGKQRDYEKKST